MHPFVLLGETRFKMSATQLSRRKPLRTILVIFIFENKRRRERLVSCFE